MSHCWWTVQHKIIIFSSELMNLKLTNNRVKTKKFCGKRVDAITLHTYTYCWSGPWSRNEGLKVQLQASPLFTPVASSPHSSFITPRQQALPLLIILEDCEGVDAAWAQWDLDLDSCHASFSGWGNLPVADKLSHRSKPNLLPTRSCSVE